MELLRRILLSRQSRLNGWWAGVGALVGLVMLLLSVQIYIDVRALANKTANFVILNKKISLVGTLVSLLGADANSFSDADIERFKKKSFVKSLAPLTSNAYKVSCANASLGFRSDLFFQALPNQYLDVDTTQFTWAEGQELVPIVMSYDYLALYNFAYAPSQNFPPLTAGTIGRVDIDLYLSGNGTFKQYKGRVIGFSRRINSILVPHNFLVYSNNHFGTSKKLPTQLMLEVDNAFSQEFEQFLETEGIEITRGLGDKVKSLANVVGPVLWGVGLLLVLLSILVFVLNFRLLVSEAAADIKLLMQLGHYPQNILAVLSKKFLNQLIITFALVALLLVVLRYILGVFFIKQGFDLGYMVHPFVWVLFVLAIILFWTMNLKSLKQSVQKLT